MEIYNYFDYLITKWSSYSPSPLWLVSLPLKINAQKPSKLFVLTMLELPTQFAKKLPKPEDQTWLPISTAWSTTTRWKETAGHASVWLPKLMASTSKDADLYSFFIFNLINFIPIYWTHPNPNPIYFNQINELTKNYNL